jgi:RHS repeat-associated protein
VYDKASNLASVADDFSSLAWTYDARDRAITESNVGTSGAADVQLTLTYDDFGNLLSVTDTINGSAGAATSYLYDSLNRMERITQTAAGTSAVADKRIDLGYTAIGQFASIIRYSDLAANSLVAGSTYQYDSLNRLERLAHDNTTSTVAFYDYVYDGDDRIISISDVDSVTSYTYDDRDQLTGADHTEPGNPDETYRYDANGNRVESHLHNDGYVTGPANRLLSDGSFDYEYDGEGNRIRQTNIASGNYREFEYDHRNRLLAVVDFSSDDAEQQRVEFVYDAVNRRIATTTDDAITHFVYFGDDVLLDFVDTDGVGGNAPQLSQRYLHGPIIDQVLAQEAADGDVSWLLTDHLGTTRDLVDETGQVVNHIQYDSYGNVISQTNPSVETRYLFTGREIETSLDLYYYRSRFYDSNEGVFLSEDTLRFIDGPNLSRYVLNDPVSNIDPLGTDASNGAGNAVQNTVQQAGDILGAGEAAPSIGRIDSIDGDKICFIQRAGSTKRVRAKVGDKIYVGDTLTAGDGSLLSARLSLGGRVNLDSGSTAKFTGERNAEITTPFANTFESYKQHVRDRVGGKPKALTIQTAGGTTIKG